MPLRVRGFRTLAVLCIAVLGTGAIEDGMSYKSLVLGSLSSGQKASGRVAQSSCHNYFINVTASRHNLVVDLDTSSTELFLLVKASPILRHSLEEEHNYARYYQFKKQGDHHGVVVTSEHLSPGRWYIGVCNYGEEAALFASPSDTPGTGARSGAAAARDPEYSVVATLKPQEGAALGGAPAREGKGEAADRAEPVPCARDSTCGTCSKGSKGDSARADAGAARAAAAADGWAGGRGAARAREKEPATLEVAGAPLDSASAEHSALLWAVRAEALQGELGRARAQLDAARDAARACALGAGRLPGGGASCWGAGAGVSALLVVLLASGAAVLRRRGAPALPAGDAGVDKGAAREAAARRALGESLGACRALEEALGAERASCRDHAAARRAAEQRAAVAEAAAAAQAAAGGADAAGAAEAAAAAERETWRGQAARAEREAARARAACEEAEARLARALRERAGLEKAADVLEQELAAARADNARLAAAAAAGPSAPAPGDGGGGTRVASPPAVRAGCGSGGVAAAPGARGEAAAGARLAALEAFMRSPLEPFQKGPAEGEGAGGGLTPLAELGGGGGMATPLSELSEEGGGSARHLAWDLSGALDESHPMTRARGRRGGQRRKKAGAEGAPAGDGGRRFGRSSTENMAVAMALSALEDSDAD